MGTRQESYKIFYRSLSELRQHLHATGRIDDSNAKLDELVKILSVCIASTRNWVGKDKLENLVHFGRHNGSTVRELQDLFRECVKLEQFKNHDGTSIFGHNPALNLQDSDNEFAYLLLVAVYTSMTRSVDNDKSHSAFDVVNEAFGHFVRDNFRGNIEDAQYMTPIEVVEFICNWAIHDIIAESSSVFQNTFTVLDPSCGVGSFLAGFFSAVKRSNPEYPKHMKLIGIDKVDRMVRLSRINLMLFGTAQYDIQQGNSLFANKTLDLQNGTVDLIITNPPFGARIPASRISNEPKANYSLLNDAHTLGPTIDSELLFIDRNISLLREGGRLFIVVPDSTISSRGIPETLRNRLAGIAKLKGVVGLPSVTFAQAGTRTRTSILYLQKCSSTDTGSTSIMATAESLGFQVSMRKGVAVKKYEGKNDLVDLAASMKRSHKRCGVLSELPSSVRVRSCDVIANSWTASHYSARRIGAEARIASMKEYIGRELKDIVNFETRSRRRLKEKDGSRCISVLHVIGDGLISFSGLMSYNPITRGNVCYPGDILISKINPRIPRVMVVPALEFPTTCSTEFEIITPRDGIDPYWVAYMLYEDVVQDQIQSLTSGTSSSHSRIKTRDLERVIIPVPSTVRKRRTVEDRAAKYSREVQAIVSSSYELVRMRMDPL